MKTSTFYEVCAGSTGRIDYIHWKSWGQHTRYFRDNKINYSYKKVRRPCITCEGCEETLMSDWGMVFTERGKERNFCMRCYIRHEREGRYEEYITEYRESKQIPH